MSPLVLPLSFSEAAQYPRRPDANLCALVAIHGPTEPALETHATLPRLDLLFDDIDSPDPADPIATARASLRRHDLAALGRPQLPPTPDHVQQLITFARSIHHLQGTLLLHCSAGISRSPAAALICLATWSSPGDEPACARLLFHLRPAALPHPDLLRFADTLLHRQGNLLKAARPPSPQF